MFAIYSQALRSRQLMHSFNLHLASPQQVPQFQWTHRCNRSCAILLLISATLFLSGFDQSNGLKHDIAIGKIRLSAGVGLLVRRVLLIRRSLAAPGCVLPIVMTSLLPSMCISSAMLSVWPGNGKGSDAMQPKWTPWKNAMSKTEQRKQ